MKILLLLLLCMVKMSSMTRIKSYSTIEIQENVEVGKELVNLNEKEKKKVLLNLNGFETNYFELQNDRVVTKHWIDREEFVQRKYCYEKGACLIELHLLINNGDEYWIIPIQILE